MLLPVVQSVIIFRRPNSQSICAIDQRLSSRRFGFDTLLAEPCERPTRQVNEFLCQAVYHDHEDISADRGKDMPPAMKLQ